LRNFFDFMVSRAAFCWLIRIAKVAHMNLIIGIQ
jgi:hypothetical protein